MCVEHSRFQDVFLTYGSYYDQNTTYSVYCRSRFLTVAKKMPVIYLIGQGYRLGQVT